MKDRSGSDLMILAASVPSLSVCLLFFTVLTFILARMLSNGWRFGFCPCINSESNTAKWRQDYQLSIITHVLDIAGLTLQDLQPVPKTLDNNKMYNNVLLLITHLWHMLILDVILLSPSSLSSNVSLLVTDVRYLQISICRTTL